MQNTKESKSLKPKDGQKRVPDKDCDKECSVVFAVNVLLSNKSRFEKYEGTRKVKNPDAETCIDLIDSDVMRFVLTQINIAAAEIHDKYPEFELLYTPINGVIPLQRIE